VRRRTAVLTLILVGAVSIVFANGVSHVRASLSGVQEVPVVLTTGHGTFSAEISDDETMVSWTLSYADLQSPITQAHIHVGQRNVNGGISVWLCSNLASPPTPAGVQACPPPPATINGTFTAANVVGPASQGVAPGELADLIGALRARLTYANIHTVVSPGGEVRGQILQGHGNHEGH
jgi:hypothetical protein